nr:hypothetical protein [uncultured Chryseobacterium sp.]
MDELENTYIIFIDKFRAVIKFIELEFGNGDILVKKNSGSIKSSNLNINNSEIKGYYFHGFGCNFIFKTDNVDVEFHENKAGFTEWSLFLFCKGKKDAIKEDEIKKFLLKKIAKKELFVKGGICFLENHPLDIQDLSRTKAMQRHPEKVKQIEQGLFD